MTPHPRAARFLEQALLGNLLIHAAAVASMGLILVRAVPGGPVADDAARVAFIAEHPWLWRLGWLPWHLCAAIDVVTAVALLRTPWVPRVPAALTLAVTLCAVVPEQIGEVGWVTRGVELARQAHASGELGEYLAFEARAFHLTVVVAASIYVLMALGWTWCLAAGAWSRALTVVSGLAWPVLAVGSVGLLLPEPLRPGPLLVAASTGAGFALLLAWLALGGEQVLRRARPDEAHGRLAPWRYHRRGLLGRLLDAVANSRLLRAYAEWLPTPAFRSDITDVIYVNYLADADRLERLVPAGLELQRVGPGGRYALLSSLTYRHGHFGPERLGPLRRLLPSPVQSNWRVYVLDPVTGKRGISFVTNAIASAPHALAARLLSEGMPMHALAAGEVRGLEGGAFAVRLDPGDGSGPDLWGEVAPAPAELPAAFAACWGGYRDFLEYAVTQDRALSSQPWYGRVTRQEIALNIALESCEPLAGRVESKAARALVGDAPAVIFRVARVAFRFAGEERDARPPAAE